MISCAVTPFFRAKASSAIISVTLAPTRCAPSSVWSLALKISFINPSLAPAALAFPEAVKGNLDEGLIFTGAYGYMQDHLMHVEEVIHELMEDEK